MREEVRRLEATEQSYTERGSLAYRGAFVGSLCTRTRPMLERYRTWGVAARTREIAPFELDVSLSLLLVCLPRSRRGCGGRRVDPGDLCSRLRFVHAALEPVADPDGPNDGADKDQYPEVSHQVDVHQHGGGLYQGERSQNAPRRVVNRVGDGGGPDAARVDPQVAVEEACSDDGPMNRGKKSNRFPLSKPIAGARKNKGMCQVPHTRPTKNKARVLPKDMR